MASLATRDPTIPRRPTNRRERIAKVVAEKLGRDLKYRLTAAKRDRLAGLAMLIDRTVPRTHTRYQTHVHVPRILIEEIRKELEERD